jgi:MFS family permease
VPEPARNYAKPFAIGGFIVAEIIMVFMMLAPNMKGAPRPPIDHLLIRLLVGAFFFGPFGLAAGTGLGLLFTGSRELFLRYRRSAIVGLLVGEFFLAVIAVAFGTYTNGWLKDGTIRGLVLPVLVFGINGIAGGILIGALLAKSRTDAPRARSDWEED